MVAQEPCILVQGEVPEHEIVGLRQQLHQSTHIVRTHSLRVNHAIPEVTVAATTPRPLSYTNVTEITALRHYVNYGWKL